MKKIFIIIVIVFACILLSGFIGYKVSNFTHGGKTLKLGFEDKDKLITQTCHIREIEDSKDSASLGKFKIPFTESRLIVSYDYDVNYGLDFGNIEIKSINDDSKTIEVEIPSAEMIDALPILESQYVYLDSGNIFSRIDSNEMNALMLSMNDRAVDDCNNSNVIELAENNAKNLISAFIKGNSKYSKYSIKYIKK